MEWSRRQISQPVSGPSSSAPSREHCLCGRPTRNDSDLRTHRTPGKSEVEMKDRAFPFIRMNERQEKPRTRGLTEIRGPYYSPMGKNYLTDVLETMGEYVDSLKFAGGSFTLMSKPALREIIELAHRH